MARDKLLTVRMNDEEWAMLTRLIERRGCTASEYVRELFAEPAPAATEETLLQIATIVHCSKGLPQIRNSRAWDEIELVLRQRTTLLEEMEAGDDAECCADDLCPAKLYGDQPCPDA